MVSRPVRPPRHRHKRRRLRTPTILTVATITITLGVTAWAGATSQSPVTTAGGSNAESASTTRNIVAEATATPAPVLPAPPAPAPGTYTVAPGTSAPAGTGGELVQYRVEVENVVGISPVEFAAVVDAVTADPRGWTQAGARTLQRTDRASLRIVLASPSTVDQLCAPLNTAGKYSCRNGNDVVINADRWTVGVPHFQPLDQYRIYVINHELGHALGNPHEPCPGNGQVAPVMLQQTIGLDGCTPNPWP